MFGGGPGTLCIPGRSHHWFGIKSGRPPNGARRAFFFALMDVGKLNALFGECPGGFPLGPRWALSTPVAFGKSLCAFTPPRSSVESFRGMFGSESQTINLKGVGGSPGPRPGSNGPRAVGILSPRSGGAVISLSSKRPGGWGRGARVGRRLSCYPWAHAAIRQKGAPSRAASRRPFGGGGTPFNFLTGIAQNPRGGPLFPPVGKSPRTRHILVGSVGGRISKRLGGGQIPPRGKKGEPSAHHPMGWENFSRGYSGPED